MNRRFIYPSDPLDPRVVDELYRDEYDLTLKAGVEVHLFSHEDFEAGAFKPRPKLQPGEVIYRGWMLSLANYQRLSTSVAAQGAVLLTTPAQYRLCHHLPQWYPLLRSFTAETVVLPEDSDFAAELKGRNWPGYFVKDYVKALSTGGGSLAASPSQVPAIVRQLKHYRGEIEGGVCVRKQESFVPGSERRSFVFEKKILCADPEVRGLVAACAERIKSPFFSVDTARTTSGELRVVELGDGQVSERKEWDAESLVSLLSQNVAAVE